LRFKNSLADESANEYLGEIQPCQPRKQRQDGDGQAHKSKGQKQRCNGGGNKDQKTYARGLQQRATLSTGVESPKRGKRARPGQWSAEESREQPSDQEAGNQGCRQFDRLPEVVLRARIAAGLRLPNLNIGFAANSHTRVEVNVVF